MHFRCVLYMLSCCVLVDLDRTEPMMFLNLHVICSCIFMHAYLQYFILWYTIVGAFLIVSHTLSLSLSSSCVSLLLWHLYTNLLRPRTLCVFGYRLPLILHHLMSSFVMRKSNQTSWRTFVDEAFIRNAMSFCQTFLTLTYPLSFTVRLGVTLWHLDHLSLHDHIGVLLQYAWNWYFSTSFLLSRSRYAHCSYLGDCLRDTTHP